MVQSFRVTFWMTIGYYNLDVNVACRYEFTILSKVLEPSSHIVVYNFFLIPSLEIVSNRICDDLGGCSMIEPQFLCLSFLSILPKQLQWRLYCDMSLIGSLFSSTYLSKSIFFFIINRFGINQTLNIFRTILCHQSLERKKEKHLIRVRSLSVTMQSRWHCVCNIQIYHCIWSGATLTSCHPELYPLWRWQAPSCVRCLFRDFQVGTVCFYMRN